MMQTRTVEVTVGLFVATGLVALFFLAMKVSNLSSFTGGDSYRVTARFENIGGLKVRSPVTIAGVRIGEVAAIDFDNHTFEAVVSMAIEHEYNTIPRDTIASIYTAGLLGEQYIGLAPGGEQAVLEDGGRIIHSQDALVLEELVGHFLFDKAEKSGIEGP